MNRRRNSVAEYCVLAGDGEKVWKLRYQQNTGVTGEKFFKRAERVKQKTSKEMMEKHSFMEELRRRLPKRIQHRILTRLVPHMNADGLCSLARFKKVGIAEINKISNEQLHSDENRRKSKKKSNIGSHRRFDSDEDEAESEDRSDETDSEESEDENEKKKYKASEQKQVD